MTRAQGDMYIYIYTYSRQWGTKKWMGSTENNQEPFWILIAERAGLGNEDQSTGEWGGSKYCSSPSSPVDLGPMSAGADAEKVQEHAGGFDPNCRTLCTHSHFLWKNIFSHLSQLFKALVGVDSVGRPTAVAREIKSYKLWYPHLNQFISFKLWRVWQLCRQDPTAMLTASGEHAKSLKKWKADWVRQASLEFGRVRKHRGLDTIRGFRSTAHLLGSKDCAWSSQETVNKVLSKRSTKVKTAISMTPMAVFVELLSASSQLLHPTFHHLEPSLLRMASAGSHRSAFACGTAWYWRDGAFFRSGASSRGRWHNYFILISMYHYYHYYY